MAHAYQGKYPEGVYRWGWLVSPNQSRGFRQQRWVPQGVGEELLGKRLEQLKPFRLKNGLGTALDIELAIDARQVPLDRADGQD